MLPITSRSVTLRIFHSLQFFLLLTASAVSLQGQDLDNVSFSGRVTDQNGAVIPGAEVSAIVDTPAAKRSTQTDSEGRYRLIQLRPGTYSIQVSSPGFGAQEKKGLVLLAGQNLQIDFVLYPESLHLDPVLVTAADAASLDTTRTVVGNTILNRDLDSLPSVNRSALDLIFTLPGVTEEPLSTRELAEDRNSFQANTPEEAGNFALAGGPAYSNNITIEGLDNNDDRSARERFEPSADAIEELQVITNQFGAEYGRASGGRINIRMRGGTPEFRGRAYYFFRDESLNANTFKNNSLGLKRLPLQEHNSGFTLSGPLRVPGFANRKQAFFFVSYEFNTLLDHVLVDTLVPVEQSNTFPLPAPTSLPARRIEDATPPALSAEIAPFISRVSTPTRRHRLSTRVDYQFRETHNGAFLFQLGRLINLRQFGGGNRLAEALQAQLRDSDSISYSDNMVFSPTLINQLRLQLSRLEPAVRTRGNSGPVILITINDPLLAGDPSRRTGTLVAGTSSAGATDRSETRFQAQNILAVIRGTHSLRLGVDIQRVRSTFTDLSDSSGTFSFASAGDFLAAVPNRFRQNFLTESTQRNTYASAFIQDDWQVLSNLVFAFGLRYERESIVRDANNFAPRVSLAYDPFSSGNTVVRIGFGVFYNRALLRTIDDFTLGSQQLFFDTNSVRDATTGRLLNADERRAFIGANIRFPQTFTPNSPLIRQFAIHNTEFSRRLDPHLRIPESYQSNIGVERDLGANFVLEANYTLNRGLHLWREFNANAPVLPAGFANFAAYLASRDFTNFRSSALGLRPIFNGANAGELVRFVFHAADPANPNAVVRTMEFGVPISVINLNSFSSSTAIEAALAALNQLRPDPGRAEVEQLISAGNSFYHGLTVELRQRLARMKSGLSLSFRAGYTISSLVDDGVVNTSDAVTPGDFHAERARSLLDRRHRFVLSGTLDLPGVLGKLSVSPVWRVASGAPFNISLGGVDRNLDDVRNDRPSFVGQQEWLRWRAPGKQLNQSLLGAFRLPTIGETGNLRRNAGIGPGLFFLDLNIKRTVRLNDRVRLTTLLELDNVLNKTVFSFGSEFINFSALSPSATTEQRLAFQESFLVATRTLRQRQVRLGVRLEF